METNNKVTLIGTFEHEMEFSHEVYGEKFYRLFLNVSRRSDTIDKIPIMISERLVNIETYMGKKVEVRGEFHSRNISGEDKKRHLELFVFTKEIAEKNQECRDTNEVILDAYTCKEVTYRLTPLEREISDMLVAVQRRYGRSDYLPCIAWGRNAKYAKDFPVGTHLKIQGRIQSREYQKLDETKVAYEISVSTIAVL